MRRLSLLLVLFALGGCSLRNVACGVPAPPPPEAAPVDAAASPETGGGGDGSIGIVFLGDSLTAGFGLLTEQAYPHQIQEMFAAEGYPEVEAINAGISGDTSAGGRRRVEGVLDGQTRILVVALGANDALRGLTPSQTHDNLAAIIAAARSRGVEVLLCGMEAPTNYGDDYRVAFRGVFSRLLSEHSGDISFVPFLLQGVAGNPSLNQADGMHPNADGARAIAALLYAPLRTMVDQLG
jgi:acyl-CoA thioesterase-1